MLKATLRYSRWCHVNEVRKVEGEDEKRKEEENRRFIPLSHSRRTRCSCSWGRQQRQLDWISAEMVKQSLYQDLRLDFRRLETRAETWSDDTSDFIWKCLNLLYQDVTWSVGLESWLETWELTWNLRVDLKLESWLETWELTSEDLWLELVFSRLETKPGNCFDRISDLSWTELALKDTWPDLNSCFRTWDLTCCFDETLDLSRTWFTQKISGAFAPQISF